MKAVLVVLLLGLASCAETSINREFLAKLKEEVNQEFQIYSYEQHPFKDLTEAELKAKLGLRIDLSQPKYEIIYGKSSAELPQNFDARKQWPKCVHAIRNQAQCGSCWAFGASEALSDRFCVASKGSVNVVLSAQDLVSCDPNDMGCGGGYLNKAWEYLKDTGIVSDECLPYVSGSGAVPACPFTSGQKTCQSGTYKKYKVSSYQQYTSIQDIKEAIYNDGPLETGFMVYQDFMSYKGGIYRQKSNVLMGGHAVKIVGWGVSETNGTEYWIVANSWGPNWGENGFFRIAFGQCQFESQVFGGKPDLNSSSEVLNFLE